MKEEQNGGGRSGGKKKKIAPKVILYLFSRNSLKVVEVFDGVSTKVSKGCLEIMSLSSSSSLQI